MIDWTFAGAILSAMLVIWIYSFAFRDNMLFKLAEHIFVGTAAGYSIALAIDSINRVVSREPATYIVPLMLGLLMFMKYSKKYYWLARYGVAVNLAVGTALALRVVPTANIVRQITATIQPLWDPDPIRALNNWLILLITLGGLTYFLFTIFPEKRFSGRPSAIYIIYRALFTIGIYGMMIGFGALFANMVMTYVGLFIGVYIQYIEPGVYGAIIATIMVAIAIIATQFVKKKPGATSQ